MHLFGLTALAVFFTCCLEKTWNMMGVQKMNIWLCQPTSNLFKGIFSCNFHQNLLHHVISQPFMRLLLYMRDRIVRLSISWPFFASVRELPVALLQRNLFLRIYKSAVFYKGFVLQSLESIGLFFLFFLLLSVRFSCMHQSLSFYDCPLLILQYDPYEGFLALAPLYTDRSLNDKP